MSQYIILQPNRRTQWQASCSKVIKENEKRREIYKARGRRRNQVRVRGQHEVLAMFRITEKKNPLIYMWHQCSANSPSFLCQRPQTPVQPVGFKCIQLQCTLCWVYRRGASSVALHSIVLYLYCRFAVETYFGSVLTKLQLESKHFNNKPKHRISVVTILQSSLW